VEIFDILGAAFPSPAPIEVKFCTAKRTHMPVGRAKFDVNRCNESPLQGEKPDFWRVSIFNTGSLPLCGNPAGKKQEAQLMLTTGSTRLAVSRGQQRWYHSTCNI